MLTGKLTSRAQTTIIDTQTGAAARAKAST